MYNNIFNGEKINLTQMLDAREKRAFFQKKILDYYPDYTLLSATMNIPGEVKNSKTLFEVFTQVIDQVEKVLSDKELILQYSCNLITGPEYYLLLNLPPKKLKQITISIEEGSSLGRLLDLDVLFLKEKKINSIRRTDLGYPERTCLICSRRAKECGRNQTHSYAEMQEAIAKLIMEEKKN